MLLHPLENVAQWRALSSWRCFLGGCLSSLRVTALRSVLLGSSPDILHVDTPHTVLKLADLADIHPFSVVSYLNFVIRAYPDPFSTVLQDHIFSWANRPFT